MPLDVVSTSSLTSFMSSPTLNPFHCIIIFILQSMAFQSIHKERTLSKFIRHWTGLYIVTKKLTDVNYRIRKGRKSLVHHNRLKRCNDWLPTDSPTELPSAKSSTLPILQGQMQMNEDLSEDLIAVILHPKSLVQPPPSPMSQDTSNRPQRNRRPPDHYSDIVYY